MRVFKALITFVLLSTFLLLVLFFRPNGKQTKTMNNQVKRVEKHETKVMKKPLFYLGILSQNGYKDKRDALRKYVITQLDMFKDLPYHVIYSFVLDRVTNETRIESEKYKDILFMNTTIKGYTIRYGYKLQWFYKYIVKTYPNVHLIGRMDDDVFVCVQHMFYRLKFLEHPLMFYGWKTVAPTIDEQFFVVGRQLVDRLIKREYCEKNCNGSIHLTDSKWGTAALQDWIDIYNDVYYVYDNRHIFQCLLRPFVEKELAPVRKMITVKPFCQFFVSFHKANIKTMEFLFNNTIFTPPTGIINSPEFHNQICVPEAEDKSLY